MGPFPHDAPAPRIDADNPAGTDGFEFVEFAHPEPDVFEALFERGCDIGKSPGRYLICIRRERGRRLGPVRRHRSSRLLSSSRNDWRSFQIYD